MESLPTIMEAGEQFSVSIDTARAAYCRLKEEGYISLSKNVGAKVIVHRQEQEIAQYVQTFFSCRKNALIDLVQSFHPLFGRAQLVGLQHTPLELLEQVDSLPRSQEELRAPYAVWAFLEQKYAALGNDILMRLAWQVYMFVHAPFLGVEGNLAYLEGAECYERDTAFLCQQKDWTALQELIARFQHNFCDALDRFYREKVTSPSPGEEIVFAWNSYKKPSQLCYTLAMELLARISRGEYPVGSLLPTAKQLALEMGVSGSTVRRAVGLLGSIGVVKSAQSVGARVLSIDQTTENSDVTQPVLQRRLLDMAQSLQLFALSSREVARLTLSAPGADVMQDIHRELTKIKARGRYELMDYAILTILSTRAPRQAIRTVYSELLRQLFWGRALNGMKGTQAVINAAYRPYLDGLLHSLKERDIPQFAAWLEALTTYDLRETIVYLKKIHVPGAEKVFIPEIS